MMLDGKYVILLDAGHYAYYNQGVIKSYWESINNWTQHLMLKEELEKRGFIVYTTRSNEEKDLALYDRGYQCKKYNADLFLSIHSNAPGGDHPDIKGVVVYYSYNSANGKLANSIANNIAGVMGDGVNSVYSQKSDKGEWDYFGVLRGAVAAGCKNCYILERGFHTNYEECEWLLNTDNLRKLAVEQAEFWKQYYYGDDVMRYFKLLSNMNVRKTPNGEILGTLPKDTIVSGTQFMTTDSGTQWLNIAYNSQSAYVAVLPESKGYAVEIKDDCYEYKELYEQEKANSDALKSQLEKYTSDYNELLAKYNALLADMQQIKSLSSKY